MLTKDITSGLKVTCLITGKTSYLSVELLKEKLKVHESLEAISKSYISRAAAKLLKEGYSQLDTRIELGLSNDDFIPIDEALILSILDLKKRKASETDVNAPDANGVYWWQKDEFRVKPDWNKQPLNIEEATKDACMRPDIYLEDVCESCGYFNRCTLPIKKTNGKVPKIEKI